MLHLLAKQNLRLSRRTFFENDQKNGFTVVEIVVSVALSTIVLIGIVTLFAPMLGSTFNSIDETNASREIDRALADIKSDIFHSHGFLKKRLALTADPDTSSPAPAWISGDSTTKRALMLAAPVTTASTQSNSRQLIYLPTSDCGTERKVAYATVIYFIDSHSSLIRRTLTPDTSAACWGRVAHQKTSCSLGAGSATGCFQKDIIVAQDIDQLSIAYYSDLNTSTAIDAASVYADTDNDILRTAMSVKVEISTQYGVSSSERITKNISGSPMQLRDEIYE